METVDTKSWAAQPDVCRCCLSASGNLDLTTSFISEAGVKEVYTNIIEECFGISMSYLAGTVTSRLVCKVCACHLSDAQSFRKQILLAEKNYKEFMQCNTAEDNSIRTTEDEVKEFEIESMKQEVNDITENLADESDTPLSDLKEIHTSTVKSSTSCLLENESNLTRNEDTREGVRYTARKITKKKNVVSERKRMSATLNTILRYTNACLFRHHKSWFQCFFCHKEFIEINDLRKHNLNSHSDVEEEIKKIKNYPHSLQIEISNLECRECSLSMMNVEAMRHHFDLAHEMIIYTECIVDYKVNCSPYVCHICKQEFHVFRMLTTHLNQHYAYCICDVCGKSFLNSKRLKAHKRTHDIGDFPCAECGKVLKTKSSAANHMESVHSKRVLKCQICQKPMKHYHDRIKHMSEIHNITHKFKCHICDREYNIKHYLATHIRQTHGNKSKKCIDCGMAFVSNHGLKKHMLKHSGVKQFSCEVCCKSYARSHTLKEHMRTHVNEVCLKPD